MSGLELNKIAASVLVAGLIAMIAGYVADGLYHPVHDLEKRGYSIEVAEEDTGAEPVAEKPENILPLLASADVAAGEALTKRCTSCHTFEKGGANKVGPNLYNTVGQSVAHASGFTYSDAMAGHGGNWDYNSLSSFLKSPKKHIPGTKMVFAGLSKEEDRANLVAYLRTLSDSPVAMPTDAEIAASMPEAEEPPLPAAGSASADSEEEAIADEKADLAIQEGAGDEAAAGKTPDAEQAQELEQSKE